MLSLIFAQIFIIPLRWFEDWPHWLLYLIIPSIFYLLRVLIFSSDKLYYGDPSKNVYVRAFQLYWPSRHLAKKFNLKIEDASRYWLGNVFNKWAAPGHQQHQQWQRTLKRGYSCRLVYYCIKFSSFLFWVSLAVIVLEVLITPTNGLAWKIGFMVVLGLVYILLRMRNRTSPDNLTGVWRRFAEINKMHIHWIEQNIKSMSELNTN